MASSDAKSTQSKEEEKERFAQMKVEILKHVDADGDGQVDLWEFLAFTLGSKKQPVEFLLYDISKGVAAKLGTLLADKKFEAVHSRVLVYESEYWYGGKVFRSDPPCVKAFGQPLGDPWGIKVETSETKAELPVVRLGHTIITHEELVPWLTAKVSARTAALTSAMRSSPS
ncbi:unnamed protein product [Polarella glacialis]|uniref:EF-hand domain-containing protein n=1 Tax=Polarella glacialis TaxID=89957 RepID=A0A813EHN4_POLGL|nr:unnamed protein product [Polarella glacialis]